LPGRLRLGRPRVERLISWSRLIALNLVNWSRGYEMEGYGPISAGRCRNRVRSDRAGQGEDDHPRPPLRAVTMLGDPDRPMVMFVDEDELAQRQDRRAQRTS
jgi:hypothetical protein